jgi:hypothetical protein
MKTPEEKKEANRISHRKVYEKLKAENPEKLRERGRRNYLNLKKDRLENPEKYREKDREYYRRNSEEIITRKREYRKLHPEVGKRYYEEHKESINRATKKYREKNREKLRTKYKIQNKMKRYGLTIEQYDLILNKQGGNCAICHTSEWVGRGSHIDHDHSFGKNSEGVRGILCSRCNTGLGQFRDSPELLRSAARYLEVFYSSLKLKKE